MRNRLYGGRAGERLTLPEIPCSFDADWAGLDPYLSCVHGALDGWADAGVLTLQQKGRLLVSAVLAFLAER